MKRKLKRGNEKKNLTLYATKEEMQKVNYLKIHFQRKSDSDMLRFLINREHEKIFDRITPASITVQA